MSDERTEGKQNPLVHEPGDTPDKTDTNEEADDKVTIVQPSGAEAPRADDRAGKD